MTLQDGSASPFMDTKVVSDVGCVFFTMFYLHKDMHLDIVVFPFEKQILQMYKSLNHKVVTVELTFKQPMCFRFWISLHDWGVRLQLFFSIPGVWTKFIGFFQFPQEKIHTPFCSRWNRVFSPCFLGCHTWSTSISSLSMVLPVPTVKALVPATRGCLKRTRSGSAPLENWPSRSEWMAGGLLRHSWGKMEKLYKSRFW